MRGDSPWHEKSDLDLAVKGMSDDQIWNAYETLEKIVPSWLKFDLVPSEKLKEAIQQFNLWLESRQPEIQEATLRQGLKALSTPYKTGDN